MENLLKGFSLGKRTIVKDSTSKAFLLRIILRHKKHIMVLGILSIITSFITVYPNELKRLSVNSAVDGNFNLVIKYAIIFLILSVLSGGVNDLYNYFNQCSQVRISNFVQRNSYKHIVNLDYKEIESFNSADILTREINSIDSISTLIMQLTNLIMTIFSGVWVFILAFNIDPLLTFAVFIIAEPIRLKLSNFVMRNLHDKVEKEQVCRSRVNKTILETITSLREVKLFNMQNSQCEKLEHEHEDLFLKVKKLSMFHNKMGFFKEIIYDIVIFAVLLRGCMLILNKSIGAGDVVVLVTYFTIYQARVSIAFGMITNFKTSLIKIERSLELFLKKEEDYKNSTEEVIKKDDKFSLCFKKVSFSYNKNIDVLKDINLNIEGKKKVGIIGESGAGKTTLTRLIAMLYTEYKGDIEINNINIKKYPLKDLRDIVGVLPQDPIFFDDTIKNNILMGLENVSHKEIEEICKLVHADEFIKALKDGYEALVGEGGCKLSGGQKQRIALARCLIRNPKVVILDEPTSALDLANQEKVIKELMNILKDKTTIIISHQFKIMDLVDDIYILENGRLTEYTTCEL